MRHTARITRIDIRSTVDVGTHTCFTLSAACEACSAASIIVRVTAESDAGEQLQQFSLAGTVTPGVQEIELPAMMERRLFARIGEWRVACVAFAPLQEPPPPLWRAPSPRPGIPAQTCS